MLDQAIDAGLQGLGDGGAQVLGQSEQDFVQGVNPRQVDRAVPDSSEFRQDLAAIRRQLLKTERITCVRTWIVAKIFGCGADGGPTGGSSWPRRRNVGPARAGRDVAEGSAMWNRIVRNAVMFAVLAVGAGELRGATVVTRVDGTIGRFTLTSPNPNNNATALLTFNDITTTKFNGKAVPAGITAQLDSFVINLKPVAGPAMYTTFSINPAGGFLSPYQFRFLTLTPGSGGASFGLFGNSLVPPAFLPNAIMIPNNPASANTLLITTTGIPRRNGNDNYDFTKITTFFLSLTAPNVDGKVVNLAAIIEKGGTATGTGTFVLVAAEPSSLGLLASGALA